MKKEKIEWVGHYEIARIVPTECDFICNLETVEELEMKWSDAVKYAKKKYTVTRTHKAYGASFGTIYVR